MLFTKLNLHVPYGRHAVDGQNAELPPDLLNAFFYCTKFLKNIFQLNYQGILIQNVYHVMDAN